MQSKVSCPKCRVNIPLVDVNISTDIALCRQCLKTWNFSELIQDGESLYEAIRTPPKGTWFQELSPHSFEVGATTRSAGAFFLVPFMCVWSGFSLGGIYGTQIYTGHFNWFMSLFGIPFIVGTFILGSTAVMSVCGRITVTVDGDDGVVFTGVGPMGWRRCFNWRKIETIRRTEKTGRRGSTCQQITFDGEKRLNFAGDLNDERLDFMLTVLRRKWRASCH